MLPLGKVGPIEMGQLASGHVDKTLLVSVRQIRIVKGYSGVFPFVAVVLLC
jgi:hypothetical protein